MSPRTAPIAAFLLALSACGGGAGRGLVDAFDALDAVRDSEDSADLEAVLGDEADLPDTTAVPDLPDTTGAAETLEPPALAVERFGARLWGPILALSRTGRLLWIGTRGNPDPVTGVMHGGLYRLDLDTGAVRHYEDELPLEDYSALDPFVPEGTFGPTPSAGVDAYDTRHLAVAHTGLLLIDGGSVTPLPITHEGQPVVPMQLALSAGATPSAWLTSDLGLLRLDPTTFEVQALFTGADLGLAADLGGAFGKLAVDPDTGAVYAAYIPSTGASRVVRVTNDGIVSLLTPGEAGLPSGLVGDLVWSATKGLVYIALGAWSSGEGGVVAWDGTTAREVAREGALAFAHAGETTAFGAQILALDDAHGWLAVGGQLSGASGAQGGGLVVIDVAAASPRMVGLHTKVTPLYHWHTNHLAWDGETGRLYAAMSDLCSEAKLRNRGLFALHFDAAGQVHYGRPMLSGVRAVTFDDSSAAPWLGLRDDNGGLACEGYPLQSGFGSVQEGGTLALLPLLPTSTDGGGGIAVDPGVTALDAHAGLALGTYRDGFFLGQVNGDHAEGHAGNQALLGPSLFTEAVIHQPTDQADAIWLAGRTSHSPGDPPQLADRGPRGAALITVSAGQVVKVVRYVRASEDTADVVGLPSGDVRDLLREPDGSVLAVCAAERVDLPYDRMETPLFEVDGAPRLGGLARLAGHAVEVLAGPGVLPDPRAATRDEEGRLLVADAQRGLLRLEGDLWIEVPLPGLPPGAIPQAVWAGAGDDLALATSRGLWVRISRRVLVQDDLGFAWSLAWHDGRLFAGTDVGLVVVRPANLSATILPSAPPGEAPPFPD